MKIALVCEKVFLVFLSFWERKREADGWRERKRWDVGDICC